MRSQVTFHRGNISTGAEHGYQMSSSGRAKNTNPVGVHAVGFGMGANPANGGLAVVDLAGPLSFVGQAIAHRYPDVISGGNQGCQTSISAVFGTISPASAVDIYDDG